MSLQHLPLNNPRSEPIQLPTLPKGGENTLDGRTPYSDQGPAGINSVSDIVPGGTITSRVGHRTHPVTGKSSNHRGVDIAAPLGTPIYNPAGDLTVVKVGWENPGNHKQGYGLVVTALDSQRKIHIFGHLQVGSISQNLKPGTTIAHGEKIAQAGSTGTSTGPHLHYEVRPNNGTAYGDGSKYEKDPIAYVKQSAVQIPNIPWSEQAQAIANGELRPPKHGEYSKLISGSLEAIRWLATQDPKYMGIVPDGFTTNKYTPKVDEILKQFVNAAGYTAANGGSITPENMAVLLNEVGKHHTNITLNPSKLPEVFKTALNGTSTETAAVNNEMPNSSFSNNQVLDNATTLALDYKEKAQVENLLINIINSDQALRFGISDEAIPQLRQVLMQISPDQGMTERELAVYANQNQNFFTLSDSYMLRKIQEKLNLPPTGTPDSKTAEKS